jgi:hypothetical protein
MPIFQKDFHPFRIDKAYERLQKDLRVPKVVPYGNINFDNIPRLSTQRFSVYLHSRSNRCLHDPNRLDLTHKIHYSLDLCSKKAKNRICRKCWRERLSSENINAIWIMMGVSTCCFPFCFVEANKRSTVQNQ